MPKMVYDERYGNLTYTQRAAYRKHNVPPAMHAYLVQRFDGDAARIVAFIGETVLAKGRIDYTDVWDGSRRYRAG